MENTRTIQSLSNNKACSIFKPLFLEGILHDGLFLICAFFKNYLCPIIHKFKPWEFKFCHSGSSVSIPLPSPSSLTGTKIQHPKLSPPIAPLNFGKPNLLTSSGYIFPHLLSENQGVNPLGWLCSTWKDLKNMLVRSLKKNQERIRRGSSYLAQEQGWLL